MNPAGAIPARGIPAVNVNGASEAAETAMRLTGTGDTLDTSRVSTQPAAASSGVLSWVRCAIAA